MFVEFTDLNPERYDILIAGSGFAAVSVAKRAAAQGKRVLMIETGGPEYDDGVQVAHTTVRGRGHYEGSYWPQHWIRQLGGTSASWSGWSAPLTERNLSAWPISREDLDPFLRDAAAELGRTETFLTYAAPYVDGFEYRPISTEPPVRLAFDAAEFYAAEGDIDTVLMTSVAQLTPRADRRGISAVTLAQAGGTPREVTLRAGQSVVLAAGGLGNAQILLSSDTEGGAAVGNETDQVGRYLMEHPHLYDCARMVVPGDLAVPTVPGDYGDHAAAIVPDDRVYEAIGSLDVSMELVDSAPNPEDSVETFLRDRIGEGALVFDVTIRSEMAADPGNRVAVAPGRDPSGLRNLQTTCVIDSAALRAASASLEALGAALAEAGAGRLRIDNDSTFFNLTGGGHTMGTTRMGDDPATSVVDKDCRVHGYENLFVAGSSVFTTGGFANPTLNLIALGLRLGDKLGAL